MKLDLKKYRAVIFDMDGTMIDNSYYHTQAWQEFHKRHEIPFDKKDFVKKTSGKKNDSIFKIIFGKEIGGGGI